MAGGSFDKGESPQGAFKRAVGTTARALAGGCALRQRAEAHAAGAGQRRAHVPVALDAFPGAAGVQAVARLACF